MTSDELRNICPEKQITKCITHTDVGYDYFTDEYVLWLEHKLISILKQ